MTNAGSISLPAPFPAMAAGTSAQGSVPSATSGLSPAPRAFRLQLCRSAAGVLRAAVKVGGLLSGRTTLEVVQALKTQAPRRKPQSQSALSSRSGADCAAQRPLGLDPQLEAHKLDRLGHTSCMYS